VFKGAVLYQAVPGYRVSVAQTEGPLLIEVLNLLSLPDLLIVSALLLFFVFYFFVRWQRFFVRTVSLGLFVMFLLPFYGTEMLIIPLYQVLLWFSDKRTFLSY
jgi:hypothetical protein